jgi:hypothetical protein
VLNVPGETLRPGWTSQDFLFNTWPIISPGDAIAYRNLIRERSGQVEAVTEEPTALGLFDRTPNISPVAHFYYTQGAFRYGDHVAKLCLAPVSAEPGEAANREVTSEDGPGVLSALTRDYYATNAARYELTGSDVITHSAHPTGPQPGVSGRKHRSLRSPQPNNRRKGRSERSTNKDQGLTGPTPPGMTASQARRVR